MSLLSTVAVVVVTLITRETEPEKLDSFYLKVKPVGFWTKTALRVHGDPALPLLKLKRSLVQTIITAISLFSLLVGFGKLMFRPSDESIFMTLLLLILGLALVPVWIKYLNEDEKVKEES